MSIRLHANGLNTAEKLIKEGKIDTKHEKIDHHYTQEKLKNALKDHSVDQYGLWCLAVNYQASENSPEHYLYPFGDFENIQRALVIDIEKEAAKAHHLDVQHAAQELLKKIDKR